MLTFCHLFIRFKVWFQNRRAKMRRQLKLQGQLARPHTTRDNNDIYDKRNQQTESSDSETWERQQEGENHPWTKAPASLLSVQKQPLTLRLGKWERLEGPEGLSSEQLRSCSIAKLRAKAREHEAELHSTVSVTASNFQPQTQETDAKLSDWSYSVFLFGQKKIDIKVCTFRWNFWRQVLSFSLYWQDTSVSVRSVYIFF